MTKIEGSVSKSWLAETLDVKFGHRYYFDPWYRHEVDLHCQRFVRETLGDLELFYTESNLGRRAYYDDSQVLVGGIQPNMIVGMLQGAEFLPASGADADIAANCWAASDVSQLPDPASLLDHPIARQFDQQIQEIQEAAPGRLRPIPPFFWDGSGRAAVHGAVTSGLKFRGDAFFLEMVTDPEPCRQRVQWLTNVSVLLVRHFARLANVRIEGIHVGECAACMIDEQNFESFVVPATSHLGQLVGPVRFHSCGSSDHIIKACSRIQNIASIDVGGETSVAVIREVFGRDFPVSIAPLVDDMTADSSHNILAWYDRVESENDGGDLTIGYHLESAYNLDCLRALHRAVSA
jgi:hypothetical protein